jgi:excisionase family DNA binding protein
MLTVPEAATAMGMSERTLWELIRKRAIDSVAVPGPRGRGSRHMRFIEQATIDAFIKAHRIEAAS